MKVSEAIEARRAIKKYDSTHEMPQEDLQRLIDLVKLAPSSFNIQNYRLVVVRDPELRKQLRAVAWDQAQVTDSSVLFIMCADLEAHKLDADVYWSHAPDPVREALGSALCPFYEGKERLTRDEGIRSTALAGMTLMLAAKEMGYDTCPMVGFDPDKVAELINLPETHALSFMIAVGKGEDAEWPRGPRLPDSEVVIHDRYPD